MTDASQRFDRVPRGEGTPTTPGRAAILAWWDDRYGIDPAVFDGVTFWERGAGKLWCVRGEYPDPVAVQGLGMTCLRTGGHDWKPTTNAAQRFGRHATRNVIHLDGAATRRYVAGEDQASDWDGDRGYLFVATTVGGGTAVLGVGLYVDGTLRSVVPKGRRRSLETAP